MKLEVALLAGAETKQFLADLTKQIDRLEALSGKGPQHDADHTEVVEAKETVATAPAKKAKAKAPPVEEEASFDVDVEAEDEEDDTKEITLEEVLKGFASYAKENGRDAAIKVLQKFKVKSAKDIKSSEYAKVLGVLHG